jgi:hypothetical protein
MFFLCVYRASQKLNLNGSPHRRKRRGSQGEDAITTPHGFASGLHKHAPLLPALLQRRIAGKELTGVGKVWMFFLSKNIIYFLPIKRNAYILTLNLLPTYFFGYFRHAYTTFIVDSFSNKQK